MQNIFVTLTSLSILILYLQVGYSAFYMIDLQTAHRMAMRIEHKFQGRGLNSKLLEVRELREDFPKLQVLTWAGRMKKAALDNLARHSQNGARLVHSWVRTDFYSNFWKYTHCIVLKFVND